MSKTTQELLAEIRRLANGKMDASQVEEITEEVRAHLDASIQARLELGQPLEVAELEALESFGSAQKFVGPILQQTDSGSKPLALSTLLLSVAAVLALCWSVFSAQQEPKTLAQTVVLFPLIPAVLMGWQAGRVNLRRLAAIGVATWLLALVALSFMFVTFPDSTDVLLRSEVALWARETYYAEASPWIESQRADFEAVKSKALADFNSHTGPYRVPVLNYPPHGTAFKQAATRADAIRMLNNVEARNEKNWSQGPVLFARSASEAQRELATPIALNALRLLPITTTQTGAMCLLLLAAEALAAVARIAVRRPPSRRQSRA